MNTSSGRPVPRLPGQSHSTRDLDNRYLSRHPATNDRPYFEFVKHHAQDLLLADENATLLDIGSANGAFIHYILRHFPKVQCTGLDALPDLVAMAASHIPSATFVTGDIQRKETLPPGPYLVVTLLTLHSHFDELPHWLDNVLSLVRSGGKVLLFGPFNPTPVDVLVRLRVAGEEGEWLSGWNVISRSTFERYLHQRGFSFAFHPYVAPALIPVDESDPLRTYSAILNDTSILMNGAGLILPFALLEILV